MTEKYLIWSLKEAPYFSESPSQLTNVLKLCGYDPLPLTAPKKERNKKLICPNILYLGSSIFCAHRSLHL